MTAVLDEFPFPWFDPRARDLHTTLTQLYPSRAALLTISQRAGVDLTVINVEQAPAYVWHEILSWTGVNGMTRTLVATVRDLQPQTHPRRPFLDRLLNDEPVPTEGEPRTADNGPRFIRHTDEVTEPEALLYHDDLTMQIGRVPALIATLQRLVALAPAVCKLDVDVHGYLQEGTAFRIGPDLLLTNWHVVHRQSTGARASAVTAQFGYDDDGRGGIIGSTIVPCDAASIVSNKENDWAVIRPAAAFHDAWPTLTLSAAAEPELHAAAYIIQHPGGQRKRIGFVRNQISLVDDRVVQYLTDTDVGSSGSPVFNADGALIAVHHAGGRPQEVAGKPPTKKNEGIRISRIRADLATAGVNVP